MEAKEEKKTIEVVETTNGAESGSGDAKNQQYIQVRDPKFVMRVNCELSLCGNVIGRGGDKIRRMTEESGAAISLSDYEKGATHRIAFIRGPRGAVIKATFMVAKAINEPKLESGKIPVLTEPLKFLQVTLFIPRAHIAGVNGKDMQGLQEIRTSFPDCKISVEDKLMDGPDNRLEIEGPTEAVRDLITLCCKKIAEYVAPGADYALPPECDMVTGRKPNQGSIGGYGQFNAYGQGAYGAQAYNQKSTQSSSGPAQYLNPAVGQTGSVSLQVEFETKDLETVFGQNDQSNKIKLETGSTISLNGSIGSHPKQLLTVIGPPKGVAAALHFIAVYIGLTKDEKGEAPLIILLRMDPREIGSVIGKRGSRINAMRDESGARIEIDPTGGISVEGNSPSLAAGLMMIIMQLHEQRERFGAPADAKVTVSGNSVE
mmetsp:Transcript_20662/g.30919  ORF Transcript_20662/g.30919 Transcript_20662/m.30919 type:complete len:430 (+) Transcript_20662:61-1350(+)